MWTREEFERRFGAKDGAEREIVGRRVEKSRLEFRREYWDFLLEEGVWEDCTPRDR